MNRQRKETAIRPPHVTPQPRPGHGNKSQTLSTQKHQLYEHDHCEADQRQTTREPKNNADSEGHSSIQGSTSKTDPQFLIMPRMPQANIWRWKLASSADRPQKQSALSARLARAPLPHITCPPPSIDPLTPARAWLCRCSTRWRCCHHCNSGGCRCSY